MWVLDTNTVAYFFRGEGRVAERLLATSPRDISVPAIVAYELRYGVARLAAGSRRAMQLEELLGSTLILPFDDDCAKAASAICTDLDRRGQPIGPLDVLIAATALQARATLVTRNVGEFRRVQGLSVENWYGD
jgi:tRNA(fMet)-specific endonuclease VapC